MRKADYRSWWPIGIFAAGIGSTAVATIYAIITGAGTMMLIYLFAAVVFFGWHIIELGFLAGSPGANDYGHPEKLIQLSFPEDNQAGSWADPVPAGAAGASMGQGDALGMIARRKMERRAAARSKPQGFGRR